MKLDEIFDSSFNGDSSFNAGYVAQLEELLARGISEDDLYLFAHEEFDNDMTPDEIDALVASVMGEEITVESWVNEVLTALEESEDWMATVAGHMEDLYVDDETRVALLDVVNEASTKKFDLVESKLFEGAKMVWRRKGGKVVKGYRCTSGKKKGRLVNNPADCSGTIDLKKRFKMKKLLTQKGAQIRRKAKRTKKRNPVSLRVQRMNKARKL